MVSTLIILAVAAIAMAAVSSLLFHNTQPKIFTLSDWEEKRCDIDVRVFRHLVDINEERYLSESLPHDRFAGFHRRRTQLALGIVRLAKENADMLIRLGALARAKDDPALTREADQLIAAATHLRFNLVLARYCLWIRWMFPRWPIFVPMVETHYQHLLDSLIRVQQHGWQT